MKKSIALVIFIVQFILAFLVTVNMQGPDLTLPTEAIEKLKITPPNKSGSDILPDQAIKPINVNLLLNDHQYIVGGNADGKWYPVETIVPYLAKEQSFSIYSELNRVKVVKGELVENTSTSSKPFYQIKLNNNYLSENDNLVFAINGGWDPFPRKPQYINEKDDKYLSLVQKILDELQIKVPAKINKLIQVDLDGDGSDELLIEATNTSSDDQYSLIILYQTIDGQETSTVIYGSCHEPTNYELTFVADVSGDWNMEISIRKIQQNQSGKAVIKDILMKLDNRAPVKLLEYSWEE